MAARRTTLDDVFAVLRAYARDQWQGAQPARFCLRLMDGRKDAHSIPPQGGGEAAEPEPFVPTPYQRAVLDALEGKALRTDAIAAAAGDRSRLFRHPGGLKELQEQGLVAHHQRLGFYRPDAPPPELEAGFV